jgi:hypothetical protein
MNRAGPLAASLLALSAALAPPLRASAAESRADIETDHIDAADDGGPRHGAVFLRPFGVVLGSVGTQVAVAVNEHAALSIEGLLWPGGSMRTLRALAASVGVPIFPQRFAFHGIYVEPRVEWVRALPGPGRLLGGAVLVGYEWTWPIGATIRLGGGAAYARSIGGDASPISVLVGLRPEVDGAVGLVF